MQGRSGIHSSLSTSGTRSKTLQPSLALVDEPFSLQDTTAERVSIEAKFLRYQQGVAEAMAAS